MIKPTANGSWKTWLVGALFAIVLGLAGALWASTNAALSKTDAALDRKVGVAEFAEFKERICSRLDRMDKKLDRLLQQRNR